MFYAEFKSIMLSMGALLRTEDETRLTRLTRGTRETRERRKSCSATNLGSERDLQSPAERNGTYLPLV